MRPRGLRHFRHLSAEHIAQHVADIAASKEGHDGYYHNSGDASAENFSAGRAQAAAVVYVAAPAASVHAHCCQIFGISPSMWNEKKPLSVNIMWSLTRMSWNFAASQIFRVRASS